MYDVQRSGRTQGEDGKVRQDIDDGCRFLRGFQVFVVPFLCSFFTLLLLFVSFYVGSLTETWSFRFWQTFFHGYEKNLALGTVVEMCHALFFDPDLQPAFFLGAQSPIEDDCSHEHINSVYDQQTGLEVDTRAVLF
jgi:hypothetical protein